MYRTTGYFVADLQPQILTSTHRPHKGRKILYNSSPEPHKDSEVGINDNEIP